MRSAGRRFDKPALDKHEIILLERFFLKLLCFVLNLKEEKERLGVAVDKDGEFYIALNDFIEQFDSVEICSVPSGKNFHFVSKKTNLICGNQS